MASTLAGKVALLTGAGSGIGAETARLFAAEGAAVVVNDLHQASAEETVQTITASGGKAIAVAADVTSATEMDSLFAKAEEAFGGLDILVNNAFATFRDVSLHELREEDWDRTVAVCLKGPFLCAKRALPLMRKRGGGSLIWLSSVNALFGVGEPAYTAAKGGVISLARLVASEYGEWQIRSNVICPGTIETRTCMQHWEQFPEGFQRLKEMYPLRRIGKPVEMAQYALFLASDASSFVTGSVHVIDGGLLSGRKFEDA